MRGCGRRLIFKKLRGEGGVKRLLCCLKGETDFLSEPSSSTCWYSVWYVGKTRGHGAGGGGYQKPKGREGEKKRKENRKTN